MNIEGHETSDTGPEKTGSVSSSLAPHPWTYAEAFSRHQGLLSPDEQTRLRQSRVAIAGMGGVGGIHLMTLAHLGIGTFHLADPDTFQVANFNRQYGARLPTLGRNKAQVMAEEARTVNPDLQLRVLTEPITPANIAPFLEGVDVLLDGIDFFELEVRRLLFREAHRRGIWAMTAGPLGFSTAWLVFSPRGMTFDEYFDLREGQDQLDQLVAFIVGLAPRATHRTYLNLSHVDVKTGRGPSSALACHLCSGVAAAEVLKILLGRPGIRPAPYYFQFDAYRHLFCTSRLRWGNRHPWQRFKRWLLRKRVLELGWRMEQGQEKT